MNIKRNHKLISKNKFKPFELDDFEEFQLVTAHVLYQFPCESTFIERSNIRDAPQPSITINRISGELYHYKIVNLNMIYEKFISSSIPSILWPNHSHSTPLQYNPQSKKFGIQLNKPRLGEHIYYERFIYLLRHGLNLLSNNGFSLMSDKPHRRSNSIHRIPCQLL